VGDRPLDRAQEIGRAEHTTSDLFAASYPWRLNRGIFMTPGDEEQWTLSVQHTEADIDRYIDVFTEFWGVPAG
jgi:glutamate-1-semialdehyde aminotransferase